MLSFSEDGEPACWNRSEETLPPNLQIEQELGCSILFYIYELYLDERTVTILYRREKYRWLEDSTKKYTSTSDT